MSVIKLSAYAREMIFEARSMDRRLSMAATGATIHKINNLRWGVMGCAACLEFARSKDDETNKCEKLQEIFDMCWAYLRSIKRV
jgi:hypothetical protein